VGVGTLSLFANLRLMQFYFSILHIVLRIGALLIQLVA